MKNTMKASIEAGKKCKSLLFKRLLFAVCFLMSIYVAKAQTPAVFEDPGGQTGGDGNGSFGDGPVVPFDGGMSLLLAASGIGYMKNKFPKKGI